MSPGQANSAVLGIFDPRTLLLFASGFSVAVSLLQSFPAVLLAFIPALLMVWASGLSLRDFWRRFLTVNFFIAFLWVFLPFSIEGAAVFELGPWVATTEGLRYAALITLRSNAIIMVIMALGTAVSMEDLTAALKALGFPDKFVYLFYLTHRYWGEIIKEYQRMREALRVRCFVPGTNLHTYRTYAYVVGMLLVNGFERGQRLHDAMVCRGFDGRFHSLRTMRFHLRDWAAMGLSVVVIAAMVVLDVR